MGKSITPLRCASVGFALACLVGLSWVALQPDRTQASQPSTESSRPVILPSQLPKESADAGDTASGRSSDFATMAMTERSAAKQKQLLASLDHSVEKMEEFYATARSAYDLLPPTERSQRVRILHKSIIVENGSINTKSEEVTATLAEHLTWAHTQLLLVRLMRDNLRESVKLQNAQSPATIDGRTHQVEQTAVRQPQPQEVIEALVELKALAGMEPAQTATGGLHRAQRMCELLRIVEPYLSAQQAESLSDAREACLLLRR